MAAINSIFQKCFLQLIKAYQFALSPLFGQHCRFYPSCSQYMIDAISQYGVIRGFWLGCKRLLRCQPLCEGGVDPVVLVKENKGYD
jgi:uncharacterized protein